mmetsp:Transcript_5470/g.11304  ORF Transcript_5470/g.11304 Transcript_5470/m.11304 type:complete len:359 (+) Transcript_5470:83-1159(+)
MMYRFAELEERKEIKMNRSSQYLPSIEVPIHRCSDSSASSKHSCSSDDEKKVKAKIPEKKKVSIVRPGDIRSYDILCGRDKATFNNIGNRRFRVSISINIPRYEAAKSKAQKAEVIKFVCNVLQKEVGVRFLKRQNGSATKKSGEGEDYYYVELQGTDARKKVGHALRDMSVARQQLNQKRTDAKRRRVNESSVKNSNKKYKSIVDDNDDDDDDLMNTLLEPLPIDDVHPPQPQPRRPSHTTETIEETRRLSIQAPQQVSSIQTTDALSQIEQQHIQFQQRQQQFRELQNQQIQQHQQQQERRRQQQQRRQQQHQQLDRQYHQLDEQQHQMLRLLQQPQSQQQQQQQRHQYDEHNVYI